MKVLLSKNVDKLGSVGNIVSVSDGYARNYLFPKKLAVLATEKYIKEYEKLKEKINSRLSEKKEFINNIVKEVNGVKITILVSVGKSGEVFNSVHKNDIAEKLFEIISEKDSKHLLVLDDIKVELENSIKEIGNFKIFAYLGKGNDKRKIDINLEVASKNK